MKRVLGYALLGALICGAATLWGAHLAAQKRREQQLRDAWDAVRLHDAWEAADPLVSREPVMEHSGLEPTRVRPNPLALLPAWTDASEAPTVIERPLPRRTGPDKPWSEEEL